MLNELLPRLAIVAACVLWAVACLSYPAVLAVSYWVLTLVLVASCLLALAEALRRRL